MKTISPSTQTAATPTVGRGRASVAGVAAAGVARGVTELVSGLGDGHGPSVITAIGTRFIDLGAGSLKDVAVNVFGTNDKPALVIGIVVISLLLGAALGRASVRRPAVGAAGFVAFGIVGAIVGASNVLASDATMIVASALGALAGIVTLRVLLALARALSAQVTSVAGARQGESRPAEDPRVKTVGRRTFITAASGAGAVAVLAAAGGRGLRGPSPAARSRSITTLPKATRTVVAPATQPFTVEGLSPYITPNSDFYLIDTALSVPQIDAASWSLTVKGMVQNPFTITYADLLAMEMVEEPVTISCVSNEVGGDLIGTALWLGVPLKAVLDRARVNAGATQIVGRSVDDFTAGFPTEKALDGRTALVAVGMNGEPLPVRHGFPVRLVVAGLYGYVSATKWLKEIELTTLEGFDGYWIPRGWSKLGPVKTESRIDVPRSGAPVTAGTVAVAGVAWAPSRGISKVEVQVDDGPWQPARLGDVASRNTWVQWMWPWEAQAGQHTLRVRATDGTGETQTDVRADPAPNGASGYHSRRVVVRSA